MKHSAKWLYIFLLALVILGLIRLRFDVQVLDILPADLPVVQGLKLYQEHFANARELVVTISAANAEQAESAASTLAGHLRKATNLISEVTWQTPWLEHPGQSAELIAYLWFNQPPNVFGRLTNHLAADKLSATLASAREQLAISLSPDEIARLSYDPFGLTQLPESVSGSAPAFGPSQELFSSADGSFRILFVQAKNDLPDYRACLRWLASVKQMVNSARLERDIPTEVRVGYTGAPAFVAEISSGMEGDLKKSVGATVLIIILLFWWVHQRIAPLLWLVTLLAVTLLGTLGIGGLLFGKLSVVTVGFAAILLGLAVDYGLVLYQESLHAPGVSVRELRRVLSPSIVWSAVTTAGAFLTLNLGGLPGLGQLGSLVAIGVTLGAIIMLNFFLAPLMRVRCQVPRVRSVSAPRLQPDTLIHSVVVWGVTGAVVLGGLIILWRVRPPLDHTANALRPRHSPAYEAMEEIKTHIAREREPEWLVLTAPNEIEMARRLDAVEPVLQSALSNGSISSFTLSAGLFPHPEYQIANAALARQLAAQREALRLAAREHGFTSNSLAMTEGILNTWQRAAQSPAPFWPGNEVSRWALDKMIARDANHFYALGLVYPATNWPTASSAKNWTSELDAEGIYLASWERLGPALLGIVERRLWLVMVPMMALLVVSLWLAFKRVGEVLLSLVTLLFSLLCLWTLMAMAGWSWNLLNLMALPLLLGAGVDYSIHMQLGLRRHHGDLHAARQTIGRALFLCAATTVAGFGSNVWSSNGGLVSLGKVCAAGIACAYLTSAFLLPIWWRAVEGGGPRGEGREEEKPSATLGPSTLDAERSAPENAEEGTDPSSQPSPLPKGRGESHGTSNSGPSRLDSPPPRPSSLYRAGLWRVGLGLVRVLPHRVCAGLSHLFMDLYWLCAPQRRGTVMQNLLPALDGDQANARRKARELFHQFGLKLVDLWRYEAGLPIDNLLGEYTGWEHFLQAKADKRGVLILTPHLGNWEFGGPWLTRRGFGLQVITLAEPGKDFTELRSSSRARWNIETLVIGDDPFAFLAVIRRLEAGANVALLVDRPPPATAVAVELFGRPFAASIAAAELARASGCVLLPVYLPRDDKSYAAHVLPPIPYERAALRDRQARQQLTQEIMRAFEPIIRQHLDQWYHFVPIWPK